MAESSTESSGIGGWLAALLVAIGAVAPACYGYYIWSALDAQAVLASYGAEALPLYGVQTVIWSLSLFKLALAWSVTGAMLRFRTRATLRFAIAGIWMLCVGTVFIDWAALSLTGEPAFAIPAWHVAIWIAEGLVLAIPATAYLLRSRRVANTYPAPGADQGLAGLFE